MSEYILEMRNITKEFPGVKALNNVSFKVKKGEIKALVGENGAGKSTLMKVLSGVYGYGTYTGDIVLNGEAPAATATYNNGTIDVPAQTYSPYAITADNVDYLVEVGFYTDADING